MVEKTNRAVKSKKVDIEESTGRSYGNSRTQNRSVSGRASKTKGSSRYRSKSLEAGKSKSRRSDEKTKSGSASKSGVVNSTSKTSKVRRPSSATRKESSRGRSERTRDATQKRSPSRDTKSDKTRSKSKTSGRKSIQRSNDKTNGPQSSSRRPSQKRITEKSSKEKLDVSLVEKVDKTSEVVAGTTTLGPTKRSSRDKSSKTGAETRRKTDRATSRSRRSPSKTRSKSKSQSERKSKGKTKSESKKIDESIMIDRSVKIDEKKSTRVEGGSSSRKKSTSRSKSESRSDSKSRKKSKSPSRSSKSRKQKTKKSSTAKDGTAMAVTEASDATLAIGGTAAPEGTLGPTSIFGSSVISAITAESEVQDISRTVGSDAITTMEDSTLLKSGSRLVPLSEAQSAGLIDPSELKKALGQTRIRGTEKPFRSPNDAGFYAQTVLGGDEVPRPIIIKREVEEFSLDNAQYVFCPVLYTSENPIDVEKAFEVGIPMEDDRWAPYKCPLDAPDVSQWLGATVRPTYFEQSAAVELLLQEVAMPVRSPVDVERFIGFPLPDGLDGMGDPLAVLISQQGTGIAKEVKSEVVAEDKKNWPSALDYLNKLSKTEKSAMNKLTAELKKYLKKHAPKSYTHAPLLAAMYYKRRQILNSRLRMLYGKDLDGHTTTKLLSEQYSLAKVYKESATATIVESWGAREDQIFQQCRIKYGKDPMGFSTVKMLRDFLKIYDFPQAVHAPELLNLFRGDEVLLNRHLRQRYGKDLKVFSPPLQL